MRTCVILVNLWIISLIVFSSKGINSQLKENKENGNNQGKFTKSLVIHQCIDTFEK